MVKYVKTIEILEERVIELEKALETQKARTDLWFDECQELKKKYETNPEKSE